MLRSIAVSAALMFLSASQAAACDTLVAVAPTAFIGISFAAPVAVSGIPATFVAPLAVQVDAFTVQSAVPTVQVLAAPIQVRAAVTPRVRFLRRPVRARVSVRVR